MLPRVQHRHVEVDGVRVFYREAGTRTGRPTLLLLHGLPSGSHQFRRLIDALGGEHHVVAPDLPGFGLTETPAGFTYSFEALTDVVEAFVDRIGLGRYVPYVFDYGGPVGLRLAGRQPARVAGLVVQNANAYEAGLSDLARDFAASRPDQPGAADRVRQLLRPEAIRQMYLYGTADTSLVDPAGWTLDQHFLDQPGRDAAQVALALDYHSNVDSYPAWQEWLRTHRPRTLVLWGRHDPFFPEPGAHAYLADLPDAELHLFDTGHFALEEHVPEIAPLVGDFLTRVARLRLAVIGGTGRLGGAVAREAAARGHRVTALGSAAVDAASAASVAAAVAGHDAVVVAVKGGDHLVTRAAKAVLDGLPTAGVDRLVFVGGGGSLLEPSGRRYADAPDFPAAYRDLALDQAEALDVLRTSAGPVAWSYASPPPVHLTPGERTGRYRALAQDTPVIGPDGESRVSDGDYAAAIADTLESGTFANQRFTVGY
jgi:putative NADH-flavin reductase/pimeloyl-ACP methyl ester carboxylesterase